jgi:adenosylhomocysteine nucleosidase
VAAATRALAAAEQGGAVDRVISIGWAGALREELQPGAAYCVTGVIDARTGERFETAPPPRSQNRDLGHPDLVGMQSELRVVTTPRVADAAEKQRLASAYSAALVDMEAAAIARLAQMREIPFDCVKGVSDGYRDQLPDFNRFMSPGGRFKLARFVVFSLLRPWYWLPLMRMGENSKSAARQIAASVLRIIDEEGSIRKHNVDANGQG